MYGHCSIAIAWARARGGGGSSPPSHDGRSGISITSVWPQPLATSTSAIHSSARDLGPIPLPGFPRGVSRWQARSPSDRPPPVTRQAFSADPDTPVALPESREENVPDILGQSNDMARPRLPNPPTPERVLAGTLAVDPAGRSEERRVGKEWRSRWAGE